jgi:hypothetical protein
MERYERRQMLRGGKASRVGSAAEAMGEALRHLPQHEVFVVVP